MREGGRGTCGVLAGLYHSGSAVLNFLFSTFEYIYVYVHTHIYVKYLKNMVAKNQRPCLYLLRYG